jgi:predicted MFS family arabinose efflux permease
MTVTDTTLAREADVSDLAPPKTYLLRADRAKWSVFQLALVTMLSSLDRQVFSVLLVPIQKSLKVSDTAMGLLTGTAFALVYAVVAVPIARLADRMNRRNLIASAMVIWSIATAACGLAYNFLHLMVARVTVGVAEAAVGPAGNSIIADIVPARRRGTAFGVLLVGSAIGFAAGAALAGYLSDRFGWHAALAGVGLPGIILALLFFLTVPEPMRGRQDGDRVGLRSDSTVMDCLRYCAGTRTLRAFIPAYFFHMFYYAGWLVWAPAFLMRVHHLSATHMGALLGMIIASAVFANIATGMISDRLAARYGERWRAYLNAGALIAAAPLMVAALFEPDLKIAFALILAYSFVAGGLTTNSTTIHVAVSPPHMRGAITSIVYLLGNAIAGGTAPLIIGTINDLLKPAYGEDAVRYSLIILPACMLISALFYFLVSRNLEKDLQMIEANTAGKQASRTTN